MTLDKIGRFYLYYSGFFLLLLFRLALLALPEEVISSVGTALMKSGLRMVAFSSFCNEHCNLLNEFECMTLLLHYESITNIVISDPYTMAFGAHER